MKFSYKDNIPFILAFFIPAIILGGVFVAHDIYPFGNNHILLIDFLHQYYPFARVFRNYLLQGSIPSWTFTVGMGQDFIGHAAYYLTSPFNFFTVLFPQHMLVEALTIFLLIKIGLAGLFMAMYLRYATKRTTILLPMFSTMYALSAFTLGYYKNIMWFDTFAMLPLVAIGVHALVLHNKYKLLVVSLTLSIIFNFYMGFFICLFVAIYFFVLGFSNDLSLKDFFKKFCIIVIACTVAISMTAFLILPTYNTLSYTYNALSPYRNVFPTNISMYTSFLSILGNFLPFTPPTLWWYRPHPVSLPNLYTGSIAILFLSMYIFSRSISRKEKIAYFSALIFLIISTNVNVLDFVLHGFSITNALPFRFSFLISFLLCFMAYKVYVNEIENNDNIRTFSIGDCALFFLVMGFLGYQSFVYVAFSALLFAVYFCVFYIPKKYMAYVLFSVMMIEKIATSYIAVSYNTMISGRSTFPVNAQQVSELLAKRDTTQFSRTEMTRRWSLNDSSMYQFYGVTRFSSMANANTSTFLGIMGLTDMRYSNTAVYVETTPLTNAFLNMRYLVNRFNVPVGTEPFWEYVYAIDENNILIENQYHLPFGFMVGSDVVNLSRNVNAFVTQNDLFTKSTGIQEDLFQFIETTGHDHSGFNVTQIDTGTHNFEPIEGYYIRSFRFYYDILQSGTYYAFLNIPATQYINATVTEGAASSFKIREPVIISLGNFEPGDRIYLNGTSDATWGQAIVYVAKINYDLWQQGFDILNSQTWDIDYFSNHRISGNIDVTQEGILYTSLPHADLWRAYVNGTRHDITTIAGAMLGLELPVGHHYIELVLFNQYLVVGSWISITGALIFIAAIFSEKFINKENKDDKNI